MNEGASGGLPPVISFVGKSDSGKTTFLEKLLPELKKRGYKAGVVKHDVHGFSIDHPGKDSHRLKSAGAYATVISSPFSIALVRDSEVDTPLMEIAGTLLSGCDVVLTEGYKREGTVRIEVSYGGPREVLCSDSEAVAMVADWKPETSLPVFAIDDAAGVADFIEEKYLKPRAKGG